MQRGRGVRKGDRDSLLTAANIQNVVDKDGALKIFLESDGLPSVTSEKDVHHPLAQMPVLLAKHVFNIQGISKIPLDHLFYRLVVLIRRNVRAILLLGVCLSGRRVIGIVTTGWIFG